MRRIGLAVAVVAVTLGLVVAPVPAAEACMPAGPEPGLTALWDGISEPTATGWTQSGPRRVHDSYNPETVSTYVFATSVPVDLEMTLLSVELPTESGMHLFGMTVL